MIVFDLECRDGGHRFEGWFGSSDDFARQQESGLLTCPVCGCADVAKAVMAPNVGRKGNQAPALAPVSPAAPAPAPQAQLDKPAMVAGGALPPQLAEAFGKLAKLQAEALESSRWVGDSFADDARAMHYGEKDVEAIHGEATPDEAAELLEEGIEVAPLLFPLARPGEAN